MLALPADIATIPAMQKLNPLALGIALLVAGCQPAQQSRTWETVKAAPHAGPAVRNRSAVYAQQLHTTLQRAGVEHKVVTFRFKYPDILKIEHTSEDVAVIYKDSGSPAQPWWLVADGLWNPVWLPAGAVQRQVEFYLRRRAAIVSVTNFSARGRERSNPHGGKSVSPLESRNGRKALKNAEARNRHSAKNSRRGNSVAPKSVPVPQVNPPTVLRRPAGTGTPQA